MDLVLINLISAGFSEVRTGLSGKADPAPQLEGDALVRTLSEAAPAATNQLITLCVKDIWDSCQAVGLPAEIAEPHLVVLTEIVKDSSLTTGECASIISGGTQMQSAGRDIADRLVRGAAPFEDAAIDATILSYLATTLFSRFAQSSELLSELIAVVGATGEQVEAIHQAAPPEALPQPTPAVSNAAATLAKIERADALGISVPLLETLTVVLINRTRSADIRHDDLVGAAEQAKTILISLQKLGEQPAAGVRDADAAIAHYLGGRLGECDRALASLEEATVERSISAMTNMDVSRLAIAVRAVRADLQILQGIYHKAARHFGFAQRYLPRAKAKARWHMAEREAHFYEVAAYQDKTPSYLDQAARACSSAIATLPTDQPSVLLASARTILARLLMIIGERDQSAERFEIAAQLLTDAQETFGALSCRQDQMIAAAFRAGALARLGELVDKADLLEQAAWVVQSALQITEDHAESEFLAGLVNDAGTDHELQLALAVGGFAARTKSVELLEQAGKSIEEKALSLAERQPACSEAGYDTDLLLARCCEAIETRTRINGDIEGAGEYLRSRSEAYMKAGFEALTDDVLTNGGVDEPVASAADAA